MRQTIISNPGPSKAAKNWFGNKQDHSEITTTLSGKMNTSGVNT